MSRGRKEKQEEYVWGRKKRKVLTGDDKHMFTEKPPEPTKSLLGLLRELGQVSGREVSARDQLHFHKPAAHPGKQNTLPSTI